MVCVCIFLALHLPARAGSGFLTSFSKELEAVEKRQDEVRRQLDALGIAMVGQTAPQLGFVTLPEVPFSPSVAAKNTVQWVQVDLVESQEIHQIALIPAQVDWYQIENPTYNFPKRFKVEISNHEDFHVATLVKSYIDQDFPVPDVAPVVFDTNGQKARYVRVTVASPSFFALAELMVLKGNRNIAVGCSVTASSFVVAFPRWDMTYLVDGRTPLGPPIRREVLPYDGLYVGGDDGDSLAWMQLDLGREMPIEEVRLHPVHGRLGVDVPGFRFPALFRIEACNEPDFENPVVMFETEKPFPSPGNNPVTLQTRNRMARYVRVVFITTKTLTDELRFSLSEIEVYSGGVNVARQAKVDSSPDYNPARKDWPKSLLVDGCTSYGRIIELPVWLGNWTLRQELGAELEELNKKQVALLARVARQQWLILGGAGIAFLVGILVIGYNARRIRRMDVDRFRRRLAQDLHDEVGSNLAAIGLISESAVQSLLPPGRDYWQTVNEITQETTDAMRETLWLAGGGREEMRIDLMEHLQLTAKRMLPNQKVDWISTVPLFPVDWPMDARRQVFLFFKEALANIVRHSGADFVSLSARLDGDWFELKISDNGTGFLPATRHAGIGLDSFKERAKRLGGNMEMETAPHKGTHIVLRVKVQAKRS